MTTTHRYLVRADGPALWPEHKPLDEVLLLQQTTTPLVWEGTYQGRPTAPGGHTFKREWWRQTRYHTDDALMRNTAVGRYLSVDTGFKDKEDSAYSAAVTGELTSDYRLLVRHGWRERAEFPELPDSIVTLARLANWDGKLRGIIIEDKASGTSAIQTLQATAERWIANLLVAFMPSGDKVQRANQAAIWCKNGSVWLPHPSPEVPWLVDLEDELFTFPQSAFKDQVDSFSQLVLYLEHYLEAGLRKRAAK